jgi:hypothetical protein
VAVGREEPGDGEHESGNPDEGTRDVDPALGDSLQHVRDGAPYATPRMNAAIQAPNLRSLFLCRSRRLTPTRRMAMLTMATAATAGFHAT